MPVKIANLVEKPADNRSIMQRLKDLPEAEYKEIIDAIVKKKYSSNLEQGYKALKYDWSLWGRPDQLFPIQNQEWSTLVTCCARGWGKALDISTPIPTPNGWTTMEELQVGSKVFDEKGNPCNVLKVTDVMHDRDCYEIIFSDGNKIIADAEHQWVTQNHYERKKQINGKVRTTLDILNTIYIPNRKRKEINHSISLCEPLKYQKKELIIDPYLLGAWLGDGDSAGAGITSADSEILDAFKNRGYIVKSYSKADPYRYGISSSIKVDRNSDGTFKENPDSLKFKLKKINLIKNKHIPLDYLSSSVEDRLELLKGLMDTDGTCSKTGNCIFYTTKEILADNVYELVTGLGIKATRRIKRAKLNGVDYGECYLISFTPHIPVFKLQRKLARQKLDKVRKTQYHRFIVGIEKIESVPVKCIQVDSPSSLYVVGNFCVITHNTRFGSEWVRYLAENKLVDRIALIGRTANDVNNTMVSGTSGILSVCPEWNRPKLQQNYKRLVWPNGVVAQFFSAESFDSLRGPQFHAAWLDEFCFTKNTRIATPDGEKYIQDFAAGDLVLTHNGVQKIVTAAKTGRNITYTVYFSNKEQLSGTFNHPVSSRKHGWIFLGMLRKGDLVNTLTGTAYVTRIERNPFRWQTYNLEVENSHTYYANNILVHNCAFRYLQETLDMLKFGLRLGKNPQLLITTTPRPIPEFINLLEHKKTYTIAGSTFDNAANLAAGFIEDIADQYEGTTLGRQELYGEIIEDDKGAVWNRDLIKEARIKRDDVKPNMRYIYLAIDPAVTNNKNSAETGMTVAGLGVDGKYYILHSEGVKGSPEVWSKRALELYDNWHADVIVGEVNNGGDLIETVIRNERKLVPFYAVRASHGKVPRALPILHLYERGMVKHVGFFDKLEQQMCSLNLHDTKGKLLDVVDSMVWCIWALLEKSSVNKNSKFQISVGGYRKSLQSYIVR